MHKLIYFTRIAFSNTAQNLFVSVVSVGTLSLALLTLSAFVLIYANVQSLIKASTQDLSVSVYLADGVSPARLAKLKNSLSEMPQTVSLSYISKSQALADLKRRFGTYGNLLDGLEENPLPASLELELKPEYRSQEQIKALIERLRSFNGVTDVDYAWEWADKLSGLLNFLKLCGFIIGGLLFLATVFIVSNTIKLTLYSRQEEIYIMRLIGATEGFIKAPFFIEGFLQGLVGGLLALVTLFLIFSLLVSRIKFPLGLSAVHLTFLSSAVSWALVGSGIFLGVLGSVVSLRRFLR
ncbi:MAG: ABC transporter permease [Deltaproteobacteria bacterium]|nr:ABC transporter permease [Deltaproteobacteria bacterium]MBW2085202.1 ABC transporter permease [Deltaproteobacteria bacterium]